MWSLMQYCNLSFDIQYFERYRALQYRGNSSWHVWRELHRSDMSSLGHDRRAAPNRYVVPLERRLRRPVAIIVAAFVVAGIFLLPFGIDPLACMATLLSARSARSMDSQKRCCT